MLLLLGEPGPALLVNLEPPSVQLELVLVVKGVVHAAAVGELDDALALALVVHVGIGDLAGGPEVVLQVLQKKAKRAHPSCKEACIFHFEIILAGHFWENIYWLRTYFYREARFVNIKPIKTDFGYFDLLLDLAASKRSGT